MYPFDSKIMRLQKGTDFINIYLIPSFKTLKVFHWEDIYEAGMRERI